MRQRAAPCHDEQRDEVSASANDGCPNATLSFKTPLHETPKRHQARVQGKDDTKTSRSGDVKDTTKSTPSTKSETSDYTMSNLMSETTVV